MVGGHASVETIPTAGSNPARIHYNQESDAMTGIDFIGVMRRDDTKEMLSLMDTYYSKYFGIPGWTEDEHILPDKKDMVLAAHDMIRLANSVARPAHDLMREISSLKFQIEKLKQTSNSEDGK